MYGKIFASMYSGSMVGAGPLVFACWAYVLANKDQDGLVELNPVLIAAAIGQCNPEDVARVIEGFCEPDAKSRSKDEEGRKLIKQADFLYRVVNCKIYDAIVKQADRRTYMRGYMKDYRSSRSKTKRKHRVNKSKHSLSMSISTSKSESSLNKGELEGETEKQPKRPFLEYVFLTDAEYAKLVEKFGKEGADERIQELNEGIGSKGYKYKSHYYTILNWDRRHAKEQTKEDHPLETPEQTLARLKSKGLLYEAKV